MTDTLEVLTKPFAPEDYKSFEGRGGRRFTYIEDEKVMSRLDEAFGFDGWDIDVERADPDTYAVKVTIVAGGSKRSDYGYPTNIDSAEPLKESVSDGIRRVGRMFGIARDVYEGKVAPGGGQNAPQARNSARSAPQAAQRPVAPSEPHEAGISGAIAQMAERVFGDEARIPQPGDPCPKHPNERLIAGRDATGPDGLYHQDGLKPDGKRNWCSPYRQPRQRR